MQIIVEIDDNIIDDINSAVFEETGKHCTKDQLIEFVRVDLLDLYRTNYILDGDRDLFDGDLKYRILDYFEKIL